jgi:glutamate/tyrosine decarboxylase-like PLP-dependent enzyme
MRNSDGRSTFARCLTAAADLVRRAGTYSPKCVPGVGLTLAGSSPHAKMRRRRTLEIPRNRIPQGELDPDTAYEIVHDELMLDGNARLNLTDGRQLPVFAFTLTDAETGYSVFDVSAALRERGWLVPAYGFPATTGADLSCGRT